MDDLKKLYQLAMSQMWAKVALGVLAATVVWRLFDVIWVAAIIGLAVFGLNQLLASHGGIVGAAKKASKKLDEELK